MIAARSLRLLVLVSSPFMASVAIGADGDQHRPNIVLIFTDDQGFNDVSCYGSEIPTPHIDSLAADGLRFTQWYSASSICTPSRFGLLTGHNPVSSDDQLLSALMFLSDVDKQRGLRPSETTIASRLHEAGYRTALIGKWHLGHGDPNFLPTRHGFQSFFGHTGGCVDFFTLRYGNSPDWYRDETHIDRTGYVTDIITDEVVTFLDDTGEQPFFLYLAYNAPHFGKGWNDGESTTVNQLQPPPADLARVASIDDITRRKYAAKVVNLDDNIGRVLTALEQSGHADNTLVVFLTDHGGDVRYGGSNLPYRDGKATLFEGGLRVPCIMRWPSTIEPGTVVEDRYWSLDLAPTLAQLAGANSDSSWTGVDMTPLLHGHDLSDDTHIDERTMIWMTGKHRELGRGTWTAIRQGPWKLISDSKAQTYLFDIDADPYEQSNLVDSNGARASALQSELKSYIESAAN